MGEFTFGAFVLGLQSFLSRFAKIALSIILVMIALSTIVPLLPDDPFRSDILSISATFNQWSDFLNWLLPTGFIVTSTLFAIECKIFFFITRMALDYLGINFFKQFGTDPDIYGNTVTWDSTGDADLR